MDEQEAAQPLDLAQELRQAVARALAEGPLGHALADVGRHALAAVAQGDEALHRAVDLVALALPGLDLRDQRAVVETVVLVLGRGAAFLQPSS